MNGNVNQVVGQDIKGNGGDCNSNSVNQNVNQDIVNTDGKIAESINQNIHQKISDKTTSIDQNSFRAIKSHDKKSKQECHCPKEVIFKRRHSKCGCKDVESSEEIKICDGNHSSEIVFKNHDAGSNSLSEESSEEIKVRYNFEDKNICSRSRQESFEEETECKNSCNVCRKEESGDSSEEFNINNLIRPCAIKKIYDISSEEETPKVKPPCGCLAKSEQVSSSSSSAETEEDPEEEASEELSKEEKYCGTSDSDSSISEEYRPYFYPYKTNAKKQKVVIKKKQKAKKPCIVDTSEQWY